MWTSATSEVSYKMVISKRNVVQIQYDCGADDG